MQRETGDMRGDKAWEANPAATTLWDPSPGIISSRHKRTKNKQSSHCHYWQCFSCLMHGRRGQVTWERKKGRESRRKAQGTEVAMTTGTFSGGIPLTRSPKDSQHTGLWKIPEQHWHVHILLQQGVRATTNIEQIYTGILQLKLQQL